MNGKFYHRDTETQRSNQITKKIIGCSIEVHRAVGSGLLESAYEECLCFELSQNNLNFKRQVPLPLIYTIVKLDCGYRTNIVVENLVIIKVKTVKEIIEIHKAQLLSYLKLTDKPLGLILNFHVSVLENGIKRLRN